MRLTDQVVQPSARTQKLDNNGRAISQLLANAPAWLVTMCGFQCLWLATVYFSGASTNWLKISLLVLYSIACLVVVLRLPLSVWKQIGGLTTKLAENQTLFIAVLCAVMLLLGSVYARYQRVWTFDEEMSFAAARLLAENGLVQFFADYSKFEWLGTNHPPLTPVIYGLTMQLFGIDLYNMRLVALVFATATLFITYKIGEELYDRETGVTAAVVLFAFPLLIRQATAAMTDVPVTFFFALSVWLVLLLWRSGSFRLAALAGVIMGAGLLTKYTMAFLAPMLASQYIVYARMRARTWQLILTGAIATLILFTWLSNAGEAGEIQTKQVAATEAAFFLTNPDGQKWLLESLLTKLPSAIGVYLLPFVPLGLWSLWRYSHQSNRFIVLWIATVSILLLLTLPDHRYFMITFPAIALLIARGLIKVPQAKDPVLVLSLLYQLGSLYLFVDWFRATNLFVE